MKRIICSMFSSALILGCLTAEVSGFVLPRNVSMTFSGDILLDEGVPSIPISGKVSFASYVSDAGPRFHEVTGEWGEYKYLEYVDWFFSLNTYDNLFGIEGFMINAVGVDLAGYPYDIEEYQWDGNWLMWEGWAFLGDQMTGYSLADARVWPSGPIWNLVTNNNYLPTSMIFACSGEAYLYPRIDIAFTQPAPVPEPSSLLLLAAGLSVFLTSYRKKLWK